MYLALTVATVAFVVSMLVCLLTNNAKERTIGGAIMIASSFAILFIIDILVSETHAADLKPMLFPAAEARQLEQELANAHIKRQTLPSPKSDAYRCNDHDKKIAQLIKFYSQFGRNEMARQWRLHLGHIWEFSLNFCEDAERSDRFKLAHEFYRAAGDEARMRRVAMKESQRLRRLYDLGQCDERGNCKKKLLKEVEAWEKRATYKKQ